MNIKLNVKSLPVIAIALAALVAGSVQAADPAAPKTRAEVKAELLEAQRAGDLYVGGESDMKVKELIMKRYPVKAVGEGKSRAQVQAELREAQRTGNIIVGGEL